MPAFRFSPIFKYTIKGDSMKPTYEPGDKVYINRLAYLFKKPKIGNVVIIKNFPQPINQAQSRHLIKRINNISKQGFFLVGDNKNKSTDSRHFGLVKKKDIIGKVF